MTTNSTADVLSQLSAQAQLRRTTIMTNAARFGLGQVVATPGRWIYCRNTASVRRSSWHAM